MGQDKDEESYEVSTIAGVRLPGPARAFTGYANFYAPWVALGSQKGNRGVHTHCVQQCGAKTNRETHCTCIKETVATTEIQRKRM